MGTMGMGTTEATNGQADTSRQSQNLSEKRAVLVKLIITLAHSAQSQTTPGSKELDTLAKAWEYAIGDIPTQYLEDCFRRALRAKRDSYPLSGVDLNREWADLRLELSRVGADNELKQLMAAHKAGELMTYAEWRHKHSPENAEHSAERCPACIKRKVEGRPPIHTLSWAAYMQTPGEITKEEIDQEAAGIWAAWTEHLAEQQQQQR